MRKTKIILFVFLIGLVAIQSVSAVQVIDSYTQRSINTTEASTTSAAGIVAIELQIPENITGSINISYQLKGTGGECALGRLLLDTTIISTSTNSNCLNSYVTFYETFEDIDWNTSNRLYLQLWTTLEGEEVFAKNLSANYDYDYPVGFNISSFDLGLETGYNDSSDKFTAANGDIRSTGIGIMLSNETHSVSRIIYYYTPLSTNSNNLNSIGVVWKAQNTSTFYAVRNNVGTWEFYCFSSACNEGATTRRNAFSHMDYINGTTYVVVIDTPEIGNGTVAVYYMNGTLYNSMSINATIDNFPDGYIGIREGGSINNGNASIDNLGYNISSIDWSDDVEAERTNYTNVLSNTFVRTQEDGNWLFRSNQSNSSVMYLNDLFLTDGIFQADVSYSEIGASPSFSVGFRSHEPTLNLNKNTYRAVVNLDTDTINFSKRIDNVNSELNSTSQSMNSNTTYAIKLRINDSNMYMKLWDKSGSEPNSYQLNYSDSNLSTGFIELRASNVNISFDNLSITTNLTESPLNETTPPESISNLTNSSGFTNATGFANITWNWTNPSDGDFDHVNIYINNSFVGSTSSESYIFDTVPYTDKTISIKTVDINGNINSTWVNLTSQTNFTYRVKLITPTPDGAGQVVHPDIYYNVSGWNGYEYWLAINPYNQSDSTLENPVILVSNNGFDFFEPMGISNPLDTAVYPAFLSDVSLVHNSSLNELQIYYRWVNPDNFTYIIYRQNSTDGTTWGNKVQVLNGTYPNGSLTPVLSPIFEIEDIYYMWTNNGSESPNQLELYSDGSDGSSFSYLQDATLTPNTFGNYELWHQRIRNMSGTGIGYNYTGLFDFYVANASQNNTIYIGYGDTKDNFTIQSLPLLSNRTAEWDNNDIYQSTFIWDNSTQILKIWYSEMNSTSGWNLGYAEARKLNGVTWQIIGEEDTSPPTSVTNPQTTVGSFYVNNTWINPVDADFNNTYWTYPNGTQYGTNLSNTTTYLNITYSSCSTQNLSVQTVDTSGNVNSTLVWFNATTPCIPSVSQYYNNINGVNQSAVTINASEFITFNLSADQDLNTVRYRVKLVGDGGYVTEQNTSANFTRRFPAFGQWWIEQTGYNTNGATQSIEVLVTVDFNKTGMLNVYHDHTTSPIREINNTLNSVSSFGSYSTINILNTTYNITGLIGHHWHYYSTTGEGVYTQSHKNGTLIYLGQTYYTTALVPTEVTGFFYATYNISDLISVSTQTNGADTTNVNHSYLMYTYYAPNITSYCNDYNGCNQTSLTIVNATTITFNISAVDKTITTVDFKENGVSIQNNSSATLIRTFNTNGTYNISFAAYAVDNASVENYTVVNAAFLAPTITYMNPLPLTPTVDVNNLYTFNAGSNQTVNWTWTEATEGAGDNTTNSTATKTWTTTGLKTVTVSCSNENGYCGSVQWDVTVVSDGSGGGTNYDWADGYVKYPNGTAISGVSIQVNTTPAQSTTTNGAGYFSFGYDFVNGNDYWFNFSKASHNNSNQSISFLLGDSQTVNATLDALYAPNITSWSNTNTSNVSLNIAFSLNVSAGETNNITFNVTSNQSIVTCAWTGEDAVINCTSFDSYAYKNFSTAGVHTITAQVINANGTSPQVSWTITITDSSPAIPSSSTASSYASASCRDVSSWGSIGFALIAVLLVTIGGVMALSYMKGNTNLASNEIVYFVAVVGFVTIIGLIIVALINPIFTVMGC